ncbi:Gfo/Idh/MocA family protein [Granulicella paludicola]|uniref:Gfo/Idh/MocA family protein n=1 Tax=Granulicella paludicola TaxID=474951 RepID=UPI0021E05353|nr:Gfo/Idh/MocA family oxidoreductase [Granulicella paludicola]
MRRMILSVMRLAGLCMVLGTALAWAQKPVTVAVVGLEHGHAYGVFDAIATHPDVKLIAVVEADKELRGRYAKRYHLDPALFVDTMDEMFAKGKPDAVLVYTSIARHRAVVEQAAAHGVSAMVEKPLATTLADAIAMRAAAHKNHTQLLVNYETTWYASNSEVLQDVAAGKLGTVRKVIVRDGHQGPKDIGVTPEFMKWLITPEGNGAGAMFDFGCYGADLMTVMMHGQVPESVTAIAQTDQPDKYPRVDDDATIILKYKGAQAILLPSWNWTTGVKNLEVYGTKEQAITVKSTGINWLTVDGKESSTTAPELPADEATALGYLVGVMRGQVKPEGDLTALDTNMVVMQILDAAKRSAQTGRTVTVTPLGK